MKGGELAIAVIGRRATDGPGASTSTGGAGGAQVPSAPLRRPDLLPCPPPCPRQACHVVGRRWIAALPGGAGRRELARRICSARLTSGAPPRPLFRSSFLCSRSFLLAWLISWSCCRFRIRPHISHPPSSFPACSVLVRGSRVILFSIAQGGARCVAVVPSDWPAYLVGVHLRCSSSPSTRCTACPAVNTLFIFLGVMMCYFL
jgi:hypothetical protein